MTKQKMEKGKCGKSDKEWIREEQAREEDEDEEEQKLIANLREECFVCLMRML